METLNEQYRKEIECMKQIQRDIQEITTSITRRQNCLNESEDRISEETIAAGER